MALIGYEAQRQELLQKMAELQKQIGSSGGASIAGASEGKPKRKLSSAARKRIAAAQKKRWKEFRAKKAE
jgi:hypothetical protein